MMKAYAGPSNGRSGGNSTRSGRGGNVIQRAGRARHTAKSKKALG